LPLGRAGGGLGTREPRRLSRRAAPRLPDAGAGLALVPAGRGARVQARHRRGVRRHLRRRHAHRGEGEPRARADADARGDRGPARGRTIAGTRAVAMIRASPPWSPDLRRALGARGARTRIATGAVACTGIVLAWAPEFRIGAFPDLYWPMWA